jgi:hypothetical protein
LVELPDPQTSEIRQHLAMARRQHDYYSGLATAQAPLLVLASQGGDMPDGVARMAADITECLFQAGRDIEALEAQLIRRSTIKERAQQP